MGLIADDDAGAAEPDRWAPTDLRTAIVAPADLGYHAVLLDTGTCAGEDRTSDLDIVIVAVGRQSPSTDIHAAAALVRRGGWLVTVLDSDGGCARQAEPSDAAVALISSAPADIHPAGQILRTCAPSSPVAEPASVALLWRKS